MPYPVVPPPLTDTGATVFPRLLQKWLDVNNASKLDRISTFVTIPSFTVTGNWNGYSDIVTAFNFEAPNNFSLKIVSSGQNGNPVSLVIPTPGNNILDVEGGLILNQGNAPIGSN